jgi:16S rRNA (adenine1518-N6/adenine1519-N6)-dimethyltransferase
MSEGFSLKKTVEILKEHGIKLNKGLGQNFLIDKNILNKIVDSAKLCPEDEVLEIGPGIGTLTRELAERAGKVVSVEIDNRLISVLQSTISSYSNVTIINKDILKLDLKKIWAEHFTSERVKVVANLPYYITSPIVMKLLEDGVPIRLIVIMVQKEVARRMVALPGNKDYGALTVAVRFYTSPEVIATVPPTVFIPPPKVSSAIVRLNIEGAPEYSVKDKRLMFSLVKAAFGQRRKTLLNALKGTEGLDSKDKIREVLESCNIQLDRRGETLSIEEFCRLANCVYNAKI